MISAKEAHELAHTNGNAAIAIKYASVLAHVDKQIRGNAADGMAVLRDALGPFMLSYEVKVLICRVIASYGYRINERRLGINTPVKFDILWDQVMEVQK